MQGSTWVEWLMTDSGWVTIEGGHYLLIPYGEERDPDGKRWFESPCHICGNSPGAFHDPECPMGPGLHQRPENCRDCGRAIGQVHVLGCGIEQCPRCGGQYMSCACDGSEDATRSEDET
jgi:hypothetical protein